MFAKGAAKKLTVGALSHGRHLVLYRFGGMLEEAVYAEITRSCALNFVGRLFHGLFPPHGEYFRRTLVSCLRCAFKTERQFAFKTE
jgi:hypothetical protein